MDTLSKSKRIARMRPIKSRDTKPELLMRRLADLLDYRYGIHEKTLPQHPDLFFQSATRSLRERLLLHRHNRGQLARLPKANPSSGYRSLRKTLGATGPFGPPSPVKVGRVW